MLCQCLLTSALRRESPGVSIHANREKKGKSRWGKHNEMFCSTVRTS